MNEFTSTDEPDGSYLPTARRITRRGIFGTSLALGAHSLAPQGSVQARRLRWAGSGSQATPVRSRRQSVASSVWSDPTIVLPWTAQCLEFIQQSSMNPVRAGRALAMLHVAMHDALAMAVRDTETGRMAKEMPLVVDPAAVSWRSLPGAAVPSAQATVAWAAAIVLAYLFPDESFDRLTALADEAASVSGDNRQEIAAGVELGARVGQRLVARGMEDGADSPRGHLDYPVGAGVWQPTPPAFTARPLEPFAGAWRTWVLPNAQVYRPAPPQAYRSATWLAELRTVQEAVVQRTAAQEEAVLFWAGGAGTVTPGGLWIEVARDMIARDGLAPLPAARVLALTSLAIADAFLCCWDAKFAYWTLRPITADPTLAVLIPTPPFPSYPSGHSTISSAAATVLGHAFPADAAWLADMAIEAKNSRLWAGIHYAIDNDVGAVGGGLVGRMVISWAESPRLER